MFNATEHDGFGLLSAMGQVWLNLVMFKTAAKQQLKLQTEIRYTDYITEF